MRWRTGEDDGVDTVIPNDDTVDTDQAMKLPCNVCMYSRYS